jgi:hypothetical protein
VIPQYGYVTIHSHIFIFENLMEIPGYDVKCGTYIIFRRIFGIIGYWDCQKLSDGGQTEIPREIRSVADV